MYVSIIDSICLEFKPEMFSFSRNYTSAFVLKKKEIGKCQGVGSFRIVFRNPQNFKSCPETSGLFRTVMAYRFQQSRKHSPSRWIL